MEKQVTFVMQLPIKLTRKEKWYLASCPVLDIYSQGESETKAKQNLGEAIQLFLVSCFERGTLDQVLKECGFRAMYSHEAQKKAGLKNSIKVPIPFSVKEPSGSTLCRV